MKVSVFVLFFLLLKLSFSQNSWPPIGAFWNYIGDTISFIGNPVDADLTVYVVDTVEINGYIHKITRQIGHEVISDGSTNIINKHWDEMVCCILNRNDSIFNVDPHFQNEQFLFSFSSVKGDSMTINQSIPYIVDTITYEVVNLDTLRKINFRKDCPNGRLGAYVLEKVGPLSIEDTIHPDSVCSEGFGNSFVWHFNCYSGDGIEYPSACLPTKTGMFENEAFSSNLTISVVNNMLHIQSDKDQKGVYRIIDMHGKIVRSENFQIQNNQFVADFNITSNGIYLISVVTFEGEIRSIKVLLSK